MDASSFFKTDKLPSLLRLSHNKSHTATAIIGLKINHQRNFTPKSDDELLAILPLLTIPIEQPTSRSLAYIVKPPTATQNTADL
jgi:hypothetical protein